MDAPVSLTHAGSSFRPEVREKLADLLLLLTTTLAASGAYLGVLAERLNPEDDCSDECGINNRQHEDLPAAEPAFAAAPPDEGGIKRRHDRDECERHPEQLQVLDRHPDDGERDEGERHGDDVIAKDTGYAGCDLTAAGDVPRREYLRQRGYRGRDEQAADNL